MHKRTILLFLSLLLILTGCTEGKVPVESSKIHTGSKDNQQEEFSPTTGSISTTPQALENASDDTPEDTSEDTTEPTKNPEQTLNDILNELHELEQLMDGIQ